MIDPPERRGVCLVGPVLNALVDVFCFPELGHHWDLLAEVPVWGEQPSQKIQTELSENVSRPVIVLNVIESPVAAITQQRKFGVTTELQ